MIRSRVSGWLALLVYLTSAIGLPVLHRWHHALHGDDHVHGDSGTTYLAGGLSSPVPVSAFHHAAFDADLAALDLSDVAHAGIAVVDCSLADYTLLACEDAQPDHPHTFGDELLAHHHSKRPAPFNPEHGRGAIEHLGGSLLAIRVFVLAPPAVRVERAEVSAALRSHSSAPRRTRSCRGPPSHV